MKKIILILSIFLLPNVAFAALNANVVWEVRTANGGSTNGGGFCSGATGTDWSTNNNKNAAGCSNCGSSTADLSVTDGVTNGTTTITSATANFGTTIVGNVIYVSGGTGAVAANWYEVTARTDASTITVDRSTGLTAGTGVTLNIGGALNTANIPSVSVSGNKAWIKNEAWNEAVTLIGGVVYEGYNSSRGDNPTGSSRPTLDRASAAGDAVTSANGATLKNLIIKSAGGDGIQAGGTFQTLNLYRVRVTANGTHGVTSGGNRAFIIIANECEFDSNGSAGISNTSGNADNVVRLFGCIARDNTSNGVTGNFTNAFSFMIHNLVFGNSATGVSGSQIHDWANTVDSNTGATSDGFSGMTNPSFNNISSNNGRYGVNANLDSQTNRYAVDYNNYYNNGTAATNGGSTNTNEQTLDPQYTNSGSDDFSIGTNLKARGFPGAFPGGLSTGYMDIGAVQRQESASGGGASSYTYS